MRYSLLSLIFTLLIHNTLSAEGTEYNANECLDESYEEVVQVRVCKRNLLRGHYYDEQDPTDELERDTAWPSRNTEFSDQLFNPRGGPW